MTTDLLTAYRTHRAQGHNHRNACRALARRFDLDIATVARVIAQAERAERAHPNPREPVHA